MARRAATPFDFHSRPSELDRRVEDALDRGFERAGTLLWRYRVELVLFVGVPAAIAAAFIFAPPALALLAGTLVLALTFAVRRPLRRLLRRASLRRRFEVAAEHCGIQHARVVRVALSHGEETLHLRLARGQTASFIQRHAESLASAMGISGLDVTRSPDHAGRVQVRFPVAEEKSAPSRPHHASSPRAVTAEPETTWPAADASRLSLWDPIEVAREFRIDEDGKRKYGTPVTISLAWRNLLIGGNPDAGKSNSMSMILATAAMDRDVRIVGIDGKQVELSLWEDSLEVLAVSPEEANNALARVQEEMNRRLLELRNLKLRKITRDWPLWLVAIDELALFTSANEFNGRLRDIVARGRAPGIIVIAATQKPAGETIPTGIRDLMAYRWALACTTPQASDTILGQGHASRGYDASQIRPGDHGVGYLLAEGSLPVKQQAHYLSDASIASIAKRAERLRA